LSKENFKRLLPVIDELRKLGIRTSLFVDPVIETVEKAKQLGSDRIELYTEPFARAFIEKKNLEPLTAKYAAAAKKAAEIGLGVNAGHDLNLDNLTFFCKNVKPVMEVSIGHALISDAIDMGLSNAVKAYCKILKENS
jgi:pyridoxine 5-phosphate synthase